MQFSGNILFFSTRLDAVQTQLAGKAITLAQALPLRDDVSTDEITPLQVMMHYDEKLGDFVYTGLTIEGVQPIAPTTCQTMQPLT